MKKSRSKFLKIVDEKLWRQISANIHVDINSTCFRIEVNFDIEHIKFSMPL